MAQLWKNKEHLVTLKYERSEEDRTKKIENTCSKFTGEVLNFRVMRSVIVEENKDWLARAVVTVRGITHVSSYRVAFSLFVFQREEHDRSQWRNHLGGLSTRSIKEARASSDGVQSRVSQYTKRCTKCFVRSSLSSSWPWHCIRPPLPSTFPCRRTFDWNSPTTTAYPRTDW